MHKPRQRRRIKLRERRNIDEIVKDIVDALKPLRCPRSRADAEVREAIDVLCADRKIMTKTQRVAARAHAKRIGRALEKVETLTLSSPLVLAWFLFGDTTIRDSAEVENAYARSSLNSELTRLRQTFVHAANLGPYGNVDIAKDSCALFASNMMRELSAKRPASSSSNSPLRVIASRLYEAVLREADCDLERSCDRVVKVVWDRPDPKKDAGL